MNRGVHLPTLRELVAYSQVRDSMSIAEYLRATEQAGVMAGAAATANSNNDIRPVLADVMPRSFVVTYQAALGADVAMTPANTFVTVLQITVPGPGRYEVSATANMSTVGATATQVALRLTDGTTVFSNAGQDLPATATFTGQLETFGVIVETAGPVTFTLAAAATVVTGAPVIKAALAANGSGNSATQLLVQRVDNI